jgi:hypothetical protein
LEIAHHFPERVPRAVREIRRTEVLRIGGHVDAAHPEACHALSLRDAQVDVPRRHQRHRQQTIVRGGLDLGHAVVVELDDETAERVVFDEAEVLAAEANRAREDDLRVDAALVHHLEPHFGVPRADVHLVERPLVQRAVRALLVTVSSDHARGAVPVQRVPVEHPDRLAVDLLDARHPVSVLRGRSRREKVGRLRPMRVGVDHKHLIVQH